MNRALSQRVNTSLLDDPKTLKKIDFNLRKNREQDNTAALDALAREFNYEDWKDRYWNPEQFSLLYGTPVWDQSTEAQRVKLNQLYWMAYYQQIISAEIATIFFNQTSAAGLYGIEDFRVVCDTLDLESMQERAHINAFKTIAEQCEEKLFGERIFTYPMRGPYQETMIFKHTSRIQRFWRNLQLRAFTLVSSDNAFLACQYFTVRGLRTLNGKLIQHQLSRYFSKDPAQDQATIPSRVSYHHFLDESFHFNSSTIISHDVLKSVPKPTKFEAWMANQGIAGSQRDHYSFSTAINGLFWYDPALFASIEKIFKSPIFGMSEAECKDMLWRCFGQETEGAHLSFESRNIALNSYREYVANLGYVSKENREMSIMAGNSLEKHLATNRNALKKFIGKPPQAMLLQAPKNPPAEITAPA